MRIQEAPDKYKNANIFQLLSINGGRHFQFFQDADNTLLPGTFKLPFTQSDIQNYNIFNIDFYIE